MARSRWLHTSADWLHCAAARGLRVFLSLMFAWLPWALATRLLIHLGRKYTLLRKPQRAAIHVSAIVAIDAVASA